MNLMDVEPFLLILKQPSFLDFSNCSLLQTEPLVSISVFRTCLNDVTCEDASWLFLCKVAPKWKNELNAFVYGLLAFVLKFNDTLKFHQWSLEKELTLFHACSLKLSILI